jgi:hypothetical protein
MNKSRFSITVPPAQIAAACSPTFGG